MGEMLLKQVDIAVDWTVSVETQTPTEVYTGWANELGVSPTATLYSFASDDTSWEFSLAASLFTDSTVLKAFFGSEGGMGFYRQNPPGNSPASYGLTHVGRFYGNNYKPLLLLTWHCSGGDLKSYNTLFQRAGNVTIARVQHSYYGSTSSYRYDAALRISPGSIILVGEALTTITPVYLTEMTELSLSSGFQQYALLESQAVGTRRRYQINFAPPRVFILSGFARFSDGAVAELVRAWRRDTGDMVASVAPDPVTGAFTLTGIKNYLHDVTIFREGYRPLTHGPIQPFEVL
ncbi:MAG TPA: hypothetical protein PLY96_13000 [Chromatiaceae bacterium]|nr:hypothetical protein [Chromatiaceae bacterium]